MNTVTSQSNPSQLSVNPKQGPVDPPKDLSSTSFASESRWASFRVRQSAPKTIDVFEQAKRDFFSK